MAFLRIVLIIHSWRMSASIGRKRIKASPIITFWITTSRKNTGWPTPTKTSSITSRRNYRGPLYEYYAFALASNFKKKLYDHFGPDSPYPDLAKRVKAKYQ